MESSWGPSPRARGDCQSLSGRAYPGLDPCAALQVVIELDPGEVTEIVHLVGRCGSAEEARRMVKRYRDPHRAEEALSRTRAWWDRLLTAVEVETPELSVNFLLNRWLLYQTLACRIWGRSGLYQSGGAFGFRDQLQDVLALLHASPVIAREHLLRAASRQFVEGDVQHWWHPPSGGGVRTRCSDDLLWLPYAVARPSCGKEMRIVAALSSPHHVPPWGLRGSETLVRPLDCSRSAPLRAPNTD